MLRCIETERAKVLPLLIEAWLVLLVYMYVRFADINECAVDNGGCEDTCVNSEGSYQCRCDVTGFTLAADGLSCTGEQ